jgi:hypothetical protein
VVEMIEFLSNIFHRISNFTGIKPVYIVFAFLGIAIILTREKNAPIPASKIDSINLKK